MSLVKYDELEVMRLTELFKEYVRMEVEDQIAHEDIDAWGAPGECHTDVRKGYERRLKTLEIQFGGEGSISEMLTYFGYPTFMKVVNRIHGEHCPFCG